MPLFRILLFNTLLYMALSAARVTFSLLALQKLAASDWTVGLIMSLYSVVAVPLAVPMGRCVDRVGPRLPMMLGTAMVAVGMFLPAWRESTPALYVASILMGTGWLAVHVPLLKLVGDLSTPERRLANFNAYTLTFSFALLIGPPAAGLMIDRLGHGATLYWLLAMVGIALATLLTGFAQFPAEHSRERAREGGKTLDLLVNPGLRPIYFVGSLIGSAWELYTFVVPIHGHRLGLTASVIGITLGVYSGATFLIRMIMPAVARRYSEWEIVRGALLCSTLGFALLPFVQGAAAYVGLSGFMGLALGSCLPNVLSLLHHHAPAGRSGEVLGIRVTITNTIQLTVPMMVGAVGTAVGLTPVFWTFAGAMAAGLRTAHLEASAERSSLTV